MKIFGIEFWLAKEIYNLYHKTHTAPQGHIQSFVLVDDLEEWFPLLPLDLTAINYSDSSLFKSRLDKISEDLNLDLCVRSNEHGEFWIYSSSRILGICSIGRPVARFKDKNIFEITRICFLPGFDPKAERKYSYPSKFIKMATEIFRSKNPGSKFVTYIHSDQKGKYLEHAGFTIDKIINYQPGSKGWKTRSSRDDLSSKKRLFKK